MSGESAYHATMMTTRYDYNDNEYMPFTCAPTYLTTSRSSHDFIIEALEIPTLSTQTPRRDLILTMGSRCSKPSKASTDSYRTLADQAASRINSQYPEGLGAPQIAAAIPNGKEPMIVMLRQNEEGQYAYDKEHYDSWTEHVPRRASGERARRRKKMKGEGRAVVGAKGKEQQQDDQGVPAGVRGDGKRVIVPNDGGGQLPAQNIVGEGRGPGEPQGDGRHGQRSLRSRVELDKHKRAFVRRRY